MRIVSYNIRYAYSTLDGVNSFIHRAGLILDTIAGKKPDIICFQEATDKNMGFLRKYLAPDYVVFLNQREQGLTGEGLAVAFRQDVCSLYGLDVFWLSPTPNEIASKFPGQSKHSRICQRLVFKHEPSGKRFVIYNLHLEEISEDVRAQQMQLALDRVATEKETCFVLGDFNSVPSGKVYPLFADYGLVELNREMPITFHEFGKWDPGYKLDYIFTDPETAKNCTACAWEECVNGIYLSDHYPVAIDWNTEV